MPNTYTKLHAIVNCNFSNVKNFDLDGCFSWNNRSQVPKGWWPFSALISFLWKNEHTLYVLVPTQNAQRLGKTVYCLTSVMWKMITPWSRQYFMPLQVFLAAKAEIWSR